MKDDNNHVVKANAQNVYRSLPHSAERIAVLAAARAHTSLVYSE
jgi:hypothetical protein